ncbi:hypothetical protein GCM10009798_13070 [Nocardioides panacihumi]|uniref:Hsp20/alpha crystallin family protein n=1 Tax=Nocardioides panacihumi TaxID=400774 RepID=A0ABP5C144_9ACTN
MPQPDPPPKCRRFVIEFELPGVAKESIDLDVERNVLTTVHAERVARSGEWE